MAQRTLTQRLSARTARRSDDECWEWQGYRTSYGHGQIGDGRLVLYTHRVAYELANGPIPIGRVVRHRCDNPSCVNPRHLELGSQADNMADMVARGRTARGSGHGGARLTETRVREIVEKYLDGAAAADLEAEYGLSCNSVARLVRGARWGHLWTDEQLSQHRRVLAARITNAKAGKKRKGK